MEQNLTHGFRNIYNKLISETEVSRELFEQVDINQYNILHTKYYHFLNKHDKDNQTLKKLKEMNSNMEQIILDSQIVKEQLKNIEDVQKNKISNEIKFNNICDQIKKSMEQYEILKNIRKDRKQILMEEKRRNFQLRQKLENIQQKQISSNKKYKFVKKMQTIKNNDLNQENTVDYNYFKDTGELFQAFMLINKDLKLRSQKCEKINVIFQNQNQEKKKKGRNPFNKYNLIQDVFFQKSKQNIISSIVKSDKQNHQNPKKNKTLYKTKCKLLDWPEEDLLSPDHRSPRKLDPVEDEGNQPSTLQMLNQISKNSKKYQKLKIFFQKQLKNIIEMYTNVSKIH